MASHSETETVATQRHARIGVNLHGLTPDQVTATDLTNDHPGHGELVTVQLGHDDTRVSVFGTLESQRAIASAWLGQLDKVEVTRQHAAEQREAETHESETIEMRVARRAAEALADDTEAAR